MGKLSVKCTRENKSNMGCFINLERCIYRTKNGYCADFDSMTHDEILNVFDRLGQLEDAAEQREKGCDLCNKKCVTCYWYNKGGGCNNGYDPDDGDYCHDFGINYEKDRNIQYCPMCGRKLV